MCRFTNALVNNTRSSPSLFLLINYETALIADAFSEEIKDYDEATKDEDGLNKEERKNRAMADMMFAIENREEGETIASIIRWFAENRWEDLGLRHKGDEFALLDRWKRFKKK